MADTTALLAVAPIRAPHAYRSRPRYGVGAWLRFIVTTLFAGLVLIPTVTVFLLAFHPSWSGTSAFEGWTLDAFRYVLGQTYIPRSLLNSIGVSLVSTVFGVMVGAFGGYVVSRTRNRFIGGYSLSLFIIQALPLVVFIIPLFVLFARLHLVNTLLGVIIVYVAAGISVTTWTMAAYYDSIPVTLEEAAWVDGCTRFQAFVRIVLRNSLPGLLSASVFSFLLSWDDYLAATVFLKTDDVKTMPVAIQQFFQQDGADWASVMASAVLMVIPPLVFFLLMGRRFSAGGIGGSLAGR
jgi:multiple sugar transport system permease protein